MVGAAQDTGAQADDRRPLLARAAEAQRAGDRDAALRLYTQLLAANPDHARAWTNLGVLFRRENRHDLALAAQRRAQALAPADAAVRNNLANVLNDTGAFAEAAALRRQILADKPGDTEQLAMLVRTLRAAGDLDAAIATARDALDQFGEDPQLRLQLAITQLTAGDYAAGFQGYQARWQTGEITLPENSLPRWFGSPLEGRRLAVIHEQGFGDTLTCARFLPALDRFGGRVSVISRPPTARLLQGVPGVERVVGSPAPSDSFDCWAPIMDLPQFHFRDGLDLPPPAPLHLPADAKARGKTLLQPYSGKFRVGVTWTGSVTNDRNAMRSFSHHRLLPLAAIPGVQLVSLYKGPELDAFRKDGTAAFIPDLAGTDRDLADCAAVMAGLDLVISSCTVTAHIAGALGVETWTVLHKEAFWIWGPEGERSPWYPSMRLFRQEVPGEWEDVFARVEAELRARGGATPERLTRWNS